MIVWILLQLTLPHSVPQECRGDLRPFRSHSLAGSRQIFYCISTFLQSPNSFHRPFSGNPRHLVKKRLRSKLYFCWDLKWMSWPPLLDSRPVLSFSPFLRDLVLLYDKRCGANEKMLILSEMIVVGWRTMVDVGDDWPEFQAGEWWQRRVWSCFDWEWSMCAILCQCIYGSEILIQNGGSLKLCNHYLSILSFGIIWIWSSNVLWLLNLKQDMMGLMTKRKCWHHLTVLMTVILSDSIYDDSIWIV